MSAIHKLIPREVDCLVLGGGITGAGIARDAAMRSLRVMLVDSHDFASGTSHLTSKLIHGGLRYLEHGHVAPVIEGIVERDRLLNHLAPNLVSPMKFVMPFEWSRFPKWFAVTLSLQLYGLTDLLRDRRWSHGMFAPALRRDYPTIKSLPLAIAFWDAHTNDARLVMATLRTAAAEGASLWNYTTITEARFERGAWTVKLRCEPRDMEWTLRARTIVNATGPWSPTTAKMLGAKPMDLMWIKGSHILLRRPERFGPDAIVIRSVRDRRPLWAVPWENRLIIGSTESHYEGDLRNARPTATEVDDLFESFVDYFPTLGVSRTDIRGAFSGVRPIIPQAKDSENSLSRRHRITIDEQRRLITLTGGKLTTFRLMAEQAIDAVQRMLSKAAASRDLRQRLRHDLLWPRLTVPQMEHLRDTLIERAGSRVPEAVVEHLTRHYGGDAAGIVNDIVDDPTLGHPIHEDLPYGLAELAYLCRTEKVCHLLDLLKRRTALYFLGDGAAAAELPRVIDRIAPILEWDTEQRAGELTAVGEELNADVGPIGNPDLIPDTATLAASA